MYSWLSQDSSNVQSPVHQWNISKLTQFYSPVYFVVAIILHTDPHLENNFIPGLRNRFLLIKGLFSSFSRQLHPLSRGEIQKNSKINATSSCCAVNSKVMLKRGETYAPLFFSTLLPFTPCLFNSVKDSFIGVFRWKDDVDMRVTGGSLLMVERTALLGWGCTTEAMQCAHRPQSPFDHICNVDDAAIGYKARPSIPCFL